MHTKGKLRIIASEMDILVLPISALIYHQDETPLNDEDEANAKELVRRWNAFEEGGLVDKLVGACKLALDINLRQQLFNKNIKAGNALGALHLRQLKQNAKQLEAAIAEAEKGE